MSVTITVQISPANAKQLLALNERELAELKQQYDAKCAEVSAIRVALGISEEKPATNGGTFQVAKRPSGRAPKGQSLSVIRAFLESHKGSGWTIGEIAEKTGTSISTTIRAVAQLNKEHALDRFGNKWGIGA